MSRQTRIAAHVAARLAASDRRRWASLHQEALQTEYERESMSNTTNRMNTQTQVPAPVAKTTDFKDLKTGEDFRSQAAPAVLPPQPAVRSENSDSEGA